MNFEEFKQQLMEELKEALSRRVGTEVAVEENEVQKLQQENLMTGSLSERKMSLLVLM